VPKRVAAWNHRVAHTASPAVAAFRLYVQLLRSFTFWRSSQAEVDRWKTEAEKNRAAAAQAQAALATAASSLASANGTAGEENRLRPNAANNKFGSSRGKKEREEALAQILPMLAPPAEAIAATKEADPNQPVVRKIGFW